MSRVIVVVEDGIVTDVYADNGDVEVEILDYDTMKFFDKESDDPQYCHMLVLEKEIGGMENIY